MAVPTPIDCFESWATIKKYITYTVSRAEMRYIGRCTKADKIRN